MPVIARRSSVRRRMLQILKGVCPNRRTWLSPSFKSFLAQCVDFGALPLSSCLELLGPPGCRSVVLRSTARSSISRSQPRRAFCPATDIASCRRQMRNGKLDALEFRNLGCAGNFMDRVHLRRNKQFRCWPLLRCRGRSSPECREAWRRSYQSG